MIVRVWGEINGEEVDFEPIPHRPGYWEGYGPRVPGLQEFEIYAENDRGGIAQLEGTVQMHWISKTKARFTLHPFVASLMEIRNADLLQSPYLARHLYDKKVS